MKKRFLVVLISLSLIMVNLGNNVFVAAADTADVSVQTGTTVLSQSFEDDQDGGWSKLPWGEDGTAKVSMGAASEGSKSLKFDRISRSSNPYLNLTSILTPGKTYDISLKVKIAEGEDTFHLSGKVDAQSLDNKYPWLIGNKTVNATEWTTFELKGYEVPADTLEFLIWLEASGDATTTSAIYIDEVIIKDVSSSTTEPQRAQALSFSSITFEDQTTNDFVGRGGVEVLTVTDEENHTNNGSYALKVEGRTQAWNGPTLRVEKYIDKGVEYKISAWVQLISPDSSQIQLSTQVGNGDGASYNGLQAKTISTEDGWVKYEGTYRYSSVGDEYVTIYVESSNNANASFYIDDISFEPTGSGKVEIQKDLTAIKEVYKNDFLIGNIVSAKDFEGTRLELLKKHFNVVTTENAMKPVYAYSDYPVFDFSAEDELVANVKAAGLDLHGHVLVWHQQSADELHTDNNGNPLTKEVALKNLRSHITTVVEHFDNNVISWDVVNEAMNDNPNNPSDWRNALRTSGWLSAIGPDYIKEAFLAAKTALGGKDIKLYYNDYNDDNQNKAEAIYQMVKELNDEYALEHEGDLLIDGIGMQAHYNLNTSPENVKKSLEKFISATSEVSITELDITAGSNNTITDKQEEQQAYLFAQLFKIYKEHSANIARVTFWGLDDATSWRAEQNPLLFDANLQAKPAYYAVVDPEKFILNYTPEVIVSKQATATFGTPSIDGTVDAVWNSTLEIQVNQYQMAWQGATAVAKALWDKDNLYVLIQVSDAQLDKSNVNAWEQDSAEVFLDQNNAKTSSYQGDDGQYRVNYDNASSLNPSSITGFASATMVSGTNYIVEMKIPLSSVTPEIGMQLGFDVQINDAKEGARQSVAAWNDTTGTGYMDTSVFGVLTLVAQEGPVELPKTGGMPVESFVFIGTVIMGLGAVTIKKLKK